MPVLHQYSNNADYYVKSRLKGAIVTFQLTKIGQRQLLESGLRDGSKFPLSLLVPLWRAGDAYTGGSGIELPTDADTGQMAFDFPEDEQTEALLPVCQVTGRVDDLHLVVTTQSDALQAQVLSPGPRRELAATVVLNIPLPLLSLKAFGYLQQTGKLPEDEVVSRLRDWYQEDINAYWERRRAERAAKPEQLGLLSDGKPTLFN